MLPICHGDFFGGTSTSVRHFCVSTSICLSVHNSHNSCSPSLWVASLLDWMPIDVWYASCCCSFLCSVSIMSQASTTMAVTTTVVTVVCSDNHLFSQWLPWPPPWWGLQQHQISMMWFCPMGAQPLGLYHCNPLELTHCKHMCNQAEVLSPQQVCPEWLLLPLLWVEGSILLLNQLSSSHSNYMVVHTA